VQLSRHPDYHAVEVGVERLPLRHVQSFRRLVVVASQDVVNAVETARSQSDFREISRPHPSLGIFSLVLRVVRGVCRGSLGLCPPTPSSSTV
jgi:hypothetical protein